MPRDPVQTLIRYAATGVLRSRLIAERLVSELRTSTEKTTHDHRTMRAVLDHVPDNMPLQLAADILADLVRCERAWSTLRNAWQDDVVAPLLATTDMTPVWGQDAKVITGPARDEWEAPLRATPHGTDSGYVMVLRPCSERVDWDVPALMGRLIERQVDKATARTGLDPDSLRDILTPAMWAVTAAVHRNEWSSNGLREQGIDPDTVSTRVERLPDIDIRGAASYTPHARGHEVKAKAS